MDDQEVTRLADSNPAVDIGDLKAGRDALAELRQAGVFPEPYSLRSIFDVRSCFHNDPPDRLEGQPTAAL